MQPKTKICHYCGASFVPEYKNQTYCNECTKQNPDTPTTHLKPTGGHKTK